MKNLFILSTIIFTCNIFAFSQENPVKILTEKEVNFLFNYYEQDGNHSPVTGGIGTEELQCAAPLTQIVVPFDSVHVISVTAGLDYYTSASSNRIDRFVTSASSLFLSSASSEDVRAHGDIDYTKRNLLKHRDFGGMFGISQEFDVNSFSGGLHFTKSDALDNRQLSLKGSVFHDDWKLIYPGEIRNGKEYNYGKSEGHEHGEGVDYDHDSRVTSTFSLSYSQVVTKRLHFVASTDAVYQSGILNTPFHRVYFDDGLIIENPDTNFWLVAKTMMPENLPRSRYKIPVSLRVNYYIADRFALRLFYRYYFDDFDLKAHTISAELPIKLSSSLTIYPMYRFYTQTQSKYFAPFGEHPLDENFLPLN